MCKFGFYRPLHHRNRGAVAALLLTVMEASVAKAAITVPPGSGYIYTTLATGNTTQSCVATGPGGTFVGVGPGFAANANSVIQISESGIVRTVATGFNSLSDCAYDAENDILYVGDNADSADISGALTGDTVFAIPSASSALNLTAVGLELLPADSLPAVAGLAVGANGNVLAADASGPGAGTVQKILVGGPSMSLFASGFDYTSGLAINPANNGVLVAETLASFEAQITRLDSMGGFVSTLAGPSSAFGSYDLSYTHDGLLLATGTGSIASFNSVGMQSTFASGFSFPTGITTDPFSGRVDILDSFSFTANDSMLHRFTPVAKLVPGGTKATAECAQEFYGVELVAARPGQTPRSAICVDGAACDADGKANDVCVFPVGLCFRVADPRFPECAQSDVTEVSMKARPESNAFDSFALDVQSALPITSSTCFFSDGISVPVRTTSSGARAGRGSLRVKTETANGSRDNDSVRLVCQPAP